jgi:hypothetical protein
MIDPHYIYFRETQKFNQSWIRIIFIILLLMMLAVFIQTYVLHKPIGIKLQPEGLIIIFALVFSIGITWLLFFIPMITEVCSDGIHIHFFKQFFIPLNDIKTYEVRTYKPIREFGGWGIRYGWNGKAYNVSGNRGVQLVLTNEKKILIGSQKPEELAVALDSARRQVVSK